MTDQPLNHTQDLPESNEEEGAISILDLLLIVAQNIKLLIVGPLAIGILALLISFLITPTFTAITSIKPPEGKQFSASSAILESLGGLGGLAGSSIGGVKDPTLLYIAYMQSADLEDVLIGKFHLQERYKNKYLIQTRKTLEQKVKITSDKKTGIIEIAVDDYDPKFAAELANAFVLEIRLFTGKLALQEAQDRKEFLESQIKELSSRQFRDAYTQQAMIAGLIREYEAARVDEERIGPTFTQIDIAKPPELKSKPKRAQIAVIATLATAFLLLIFIFVRHAWANLRANKEAEGKLEGILAVLKTQLPGVWQLAAKLLQTMARKKGRH
jgi:uncharacterized protein involved in exopolysaccharide biosynthesis